MALTRVPSALLDTANVAINAFLGGAIANGTYTMCLYMPFSGNVISTIAAANVFGCTMQTVVGGKNLPNTITLSSNNTVFQANQSSNIAFTTGQSIVINLSNSSPICANLSATIYVQRSGA